MFAFPIRKALPSRTMVHALSRQYVPKSMPLRARMYSSSSSKPSSPSDKRPRNIAAPTTAGSGTAGARRRSGFGGVANDGVTEGLAGTRAGSFSKLPVVPNTDHLHPADVAASSFFAQHRPLSIKNSIPQVHTEKSFNSIFDSLVESTNAIDGSAAGTSAAADSTSAVKTAAVSLTSFPPTQHTPRTYERTIMGDLESLFSSIRDNWLTGSSRQRFLVTSLNNAANNNNNSSNNSVGGSSSSRPSSAPSVLAAGEADHQAGPANPLEFSSRLFGPVVNDHLPFHPPPPPVPQTPETLARAREESARPQRQLITIHQTMYPNGMMVFTARSRVIAPLTSPYMQRVRERQREDLERWRREAIEEAEERDRELGVVGEPEGGEGAGMQMEQRERERERVMWAISVKRQRKLKMKKHKYKKLMKATRNARRKLEKQ